jgi:D-alanyl-lipoteichoic acid acyltransferase DltB (MBOAT superfamily)
LYFDFSAYTDMALGSARLFNIHLPLNFNSPYKALDIQDFWRRWHMTLSRFLRDYIYIPLGGNRKGRFRTFFNIFVTFLIGGIWHGAGWTFFIWGALHGVAMIVHRFWRQLGMRAPGWVAWLLTFVFVNAAWVYFRAPTLGDAHSILSKMAGLDVARGVSEDWNRLISGGLGEIPDVFWVAFLAAFMLLDILYRNSQEWVAILKPKIRFSAACVVLFSTGVYLLMDQNRFSEFLYFQF